MKSKVLGLLIIMFLLSSNVYSQVYKYRAQQFAIKSKNDYNVWSKWSDWVDCDILIVDNTTKRKFTIYSKVIQDFDIIQYFPEEVDSQGVKIFEMICIDQDGLRCHIRHRFIKNNYFISQLYVDYSNISYVYNLVW